VAFSLHFLWLAAAGYCEEAIRRYKQSADAEGSKIVEQLHRYVSRLRHSEVEPFPREDVLQPDSPAASRLPCQTLGIIAPMRAKQRPTSSRSRPGATRSAPAEPSAKPGDPAVELAALANLGPKSAQALVAAGVTSFAQVQRLGSVATYAKVKQVNPRVTLNLLWALEGAVSGLPWQVVAKEHRTSLLLALDALQNAA
jgi:DNA transformation protein and related proteins